MKRRLTALRAVDQWFLLYRFEATASIGPQDLTPIYPPADRMWADPFVVRRDGRHVIFFEELIYAKGYGHIAMAELSRSGGWSGPEVVLDRGQHLSYPYLFELDGRLYMIPESRRNRTIDLYACTRFPAQWQLVRTLMPTIEAVDATLHQYGDRWWMFVNVVDPADGSSWRNLHLYSATDPINDAWRPHPQNPVVRDVACSRPAGKVFTKEGRLIRPSQDCCLRYGHAVNFNEVLALDEDRYQERTVQTIRPRAGSQLLGVHTYNHHAGLTMLDGLRSLRWGRASRSNQLGAVPGEGLDRSLRVMSHGDPVPVAVGASGGEMLSWRSHEAVPASDDEVRNSWAGGACS